MTERKYLKLIKKLEDNLGEYRSNEFYQEVSSRLERIVTYIIVEKYIDPQIDEPFNCYK